MIGRRGVFESKRDPRFFRVVGTHLHLYPVASSNLDIVLSQFTGNMPEDDVAVGQLHPKHGPRQNGDDLSFKFDRVRILGWAGR